MENSHIPQRPTLNIGQHQALHGSDSRSNPRQSLLKICEDYLGRGVDLKHAFVRIDTDYHFARAFMMWPTD
jgi:hypothetical protein